MIIRMGGVLRLICLVLCLHHVSSLMLIRWCTISSHEEAKCVAMKIAFASNSLPELKCVALNSSRECMAAIANDNADLVSLDGGDVYQAGVEFGLVPIMNEQYGQPNANGYHAIAVVKKSNTSITIDNLRGKKSCHTGVKKTAGWNVPIGFLIEKGDITVDDCQEDILAAGNFFSKSCAPGAKSAEYDPYGTNPESLCALCQSADCSRSSSETYYNYAGAFRCLAEDAGDVAFIKPVTISSYTDGNSDATWARDLNSADFELLCPDGSRKAVGSEDSCNLAFVPTHAVMTSKIYIPSVLEDFRLALEEAQGLFGEDVNDNGFSMFASTPFGGSDLLFKDSAVSLKKVVDMDYEDYLGESYLKTLKGLEKCPQDTLRWCVTSDIEKEKCQDMSTAFSDAGFTPALSCFRSYTSLDCAAEIAKDRADLVTLDAGILYKAGREEEVSPIMAEDYGLGDVTYWGVAVVKRGANFNINELKGKKSCHTGIGRTVGWVVPVGFLISRGDIEVDSNCDIPQGVGEFFSESCASGSKEEKNDPDGTNPSSLCALCIGEGNNKCASSAAEPYAGYAGAFRCMAEGAGDVAFVKHTTVPDNTGGTNTDSWAVNLNKADYQLLCPDGSKADVDDYESCNLARVPSHAVVTSGSKTAAQRKDMVDLLTNGQNRFKEDTNSVFKMFDSSKYTNANNLIFKDSTVQLLDTGSQDTYDKFLSKEYLADVEAIYCDHLTDSSSTLLPSFLLMMITLVLHRIARG